MIVNKRFLSWEDFDRAVEGLGELYLQAARNDPRQTQAEGVMGQPRGGLPLAVALSHLLDLPLITKMPPGGTLLWVDDIFDSNITYSLALAAAHNQDTDLIALAWFSRYDPPPLARCLERVNSDIWLVFPWERWSDPDTEMARYQAARTEGRP